ncbi:cytochrome c [Thalassomonas viridans]|uniref:Cytochrome c n=2 Tax=Thalassomonas viridans TaxID=137584 RepID=A0AAE9ZAN5_9GAMM|nr:cytochrome c [Thalassomonas viridans]
MFASLFNLFCASVQAQEPTPERQQELLHLLKQDCGSCHGMTLKGGLGPALLPQELEQKPLALINNTILFGRPGTAMPPWQEILTEQETLWLSQQLKHGIHADITNKAEK